MQADEKRRQRCSQRHAKLAAAAPAATASIPHSRRTWAAEVAARPEAMVEGALRTACATPAAEPTQQQGSEAVFSLPRQPRPTAVAAAGWQVAGLTRQWRGWVGCCSLTGGQVACLALLECLEGSAEGGCHLILGTQALAGNQVGPAGGGRGPRNVGIDEKHSGAWHLLLSAREAAE